jgi:hypothetical protein|tara:strand:- start:107 stop:871 length:765 start_codon:yes stop_codon:yes gene_type:complete
MAVEGEPEEAAEDDAETGPPTMNLKERCISLSPVSYESHGDSPSSYCQCIMDGFENPDDDDLIFSNINIPEKTSCGTPDLQSDFGNTVSGECVASNENIPDLSNIGSVGYTIGIQFDNNVSDTYLQSVTNLYNTKLNKDSEILASYIRCKEENYKPIINQFRDNANIITNFVSENQASIKSILDSGKIEITLDKIDEFPLESITPAINQVNYIKTKLDSPLLMTAIYIIAIILLINFASRFKDTAVRFFNYVFP